MAKVKTTNFNRSAKEAEQEGDKYFRIGDNRGAYIFYRKASSLGSESANRKFRRVQELLGDDDLVNPEAYAKNQQEKQQPVNKPKIASSISIPSEEPRTLIEDRSKLQQKPKEQHKKKAEEKPKREQTLSNKTEELLKKAQELEAKGNKKEAFQLLRKAADGGSEQAKTKVGQRYLNLAVKYLGRQTAFEKLEETIPPPRKEDKPKASVVPKSHFRHQRNMVSELDGYGDMAETETSVLHAEEAKEATWVGDTEKNNPPSPEVIIQEMVRHVTYWSGNDCLPKLIIVAGSALEACEFTRESGHEFSTESIFRQVIPPAVATEEEVPRLMEAEEEEQQQQHGCMGMLFLPFRKLFTIFRRWTDAEK